ncbi:hypothetical protein HNO89_003122 [Sporosarcina luteola]|nr:hypothetical protein [Sporosarcina luteola]
MKTKASYPFIYFLFEPHIVMVYKMELDKYVTVSDIQLESYKWEIFEINEGDDFETFHHEASSSIHGNGVVINQECMNEIVEEINKQIQLVRDVNRGEIRMDEFHIVATESAAGSLRVGVKRPKTVIGFPDSFSIGPLWKMDEKAGQSFRKEWLADNINWEQDDDVYANKFTNTLREMEGIPSHVPIYIWFGNNAGEQTGLRFFLYCLRDKPNDLILINSTDYWVKVANAQEERPVFHTGQIGSEHIRRIYASHHANKPLTREECLRFQKEWDDLSQTKEVLRIWKDGEIKSVPDHYYDPLIIETVEKMHDLQERKDFITAGSVIGTILESMEEYIDIYYLEFRIRHLLYSGVFELKGIPKSMRHYSIKLR